MLLDTTHLSAEKDYWCFMAPAAVVYFKLDDFRQLQISSLYISNTDSWRHKIHQNNCLHTFMHTTDTRADFIFHHFTSQILQIYVWPTKGASATLPFPSP